MPKTAYEYLLWANPKSSANSYEQTFYDSNASLFNTETSLYNENRSLFDMIKSVLVLRGLLNRKKLVEDYDQFPKEQLRRKEIQTALQQQLPYAVNEGKRIYIPTYDSNINDIFYEHPEKLKEDPYAILLKDEKKHVINPFVRYGTLLLDSPFTRLIRIAENGEISSFYHLGFETLFFVNEELDLVQELPLFDEKVKKRDSGRLFVHLELISRDFFQGDTITLFQDLQKTGLLSPSLVEECLEEEEKYQRRRESHAF